MNNNILIGAEGLDGANFLTSCLTMSDEIYFNNCSLDEKIEFFFSGMSKIQKKNELPIWEDVSMLFSGCARAGDKVSFSTYQSKKLYESVKLKLNNKNLISKIQLPLYWPLISLIKKNPEDPIVKLFESKYFIGLVNADLFVSLRTVLGNSDMDQFTIKKFNSLLVSEQNIIKDKYQSNIEVLFRFDDMLADPDTKMNKWFMSNMECNLDYLNHRSLDNIPTNWITNIKESNNLIKNKITHQWDCNWFLTENETIENVRCLYSKLNLSKFDEKLIRNMYRVWINRIDCIKKSHIKEFKVAINNFTFVSEY